MATQVRIRRRGRRSAFVIAGAFAAISLLPGTASAAPNQSASAAGLGQKVAEAETSLLPVGGSDLALLSLSGMAALGIGSMVARKAEL